MTTETLITNVANAAQGHDSLGPTGLVVHLTPAERDKIVAALTSIPMCGACGQPWTGEPCGQKDNGHPFPTCYPVEVAAAQAGEEVVVRTFDDDDIESAYQLWISDPLGNTREKLRTILTTLGSYEGERVEPSLLAAPVTTSLSESRQGEPSPAPAPLGRADDVELIVQRVARLICYEHCRAGACRDAERCCSGGQGPIHIAEKDARILLRPMLAAPAPPAQSGAGEDRIASDIQARLFLVENAPIAVSYCNTAADARSLIGHLVARIATLTQALAEAEKVMEPFGKQIEAIECTTDYTYHDDETWPVDADQVVRIGHLRAARAWLERRRATTSSSST